MHDSQTLAQSYPPPPIAFQSMSFALSFLSEYTPLGLSFLGFRNSLAHTHRVREREPRTVPNASSYFTLGS